MKFIKQMAFITIGLIFSQSFSQGFQQMNPPNFIKSVVLKPAKINSYTPVIQLGERLEFSFDDINASENIYSYKIEHCDYNWNISNLVPSEYLDGYSQDRIRDYENSFNTLQSYTHYELEIPNQHLKIKLTGNYVISVLDEYNNILFTRRFIIYEPKVHVGVTAHRSRDISSINEKHNVQFVIDHKSLRINNPYEEIKVVLYQNADWNSGIRNIPPKYIRGTQLLYNYVDKISYWGNNEFLYFDTKDIRNATNNIYQVRLENIFNTFLYKDEARGRKPYLFNPDVNGNFVIRTINTDDTALEADYSFVHFKLEYEENYDNHKVYIYGNFNDWQLTDENKMIYNNKTNLFEATLMLKQGFYNYTYITADDNLKINTHAIEGSYYQTENEYSVIVYLKKYGELYDQVIGIGSANSKNLRN